MEFCSVSSFLCLSVCLFDSCVCLSIYLSPVCVCVCLTPGCVCANLTAPIRVIEGSCVEVSPNGRIGVAFIRGKPTVTGWRYPA